ncbi:hypothetical protein N7501_000968 [Penicillium viridicatum]|nr:hypothetical protein N7501_000968 [Penicillium viridicatum]
MCLRSLEGIHHSQLGSTPLGVGPPENHLLSNFPPGTLLLLDLEKISIRVLVVPGKSDCIPKYEVLLRTFTSVCEPCRPIPHLTLSSFGSRIYC